MTVRQSRYSAEETAQRGDAIYEREIRAQIEPAYRGKVVAIDVDSGAYVVADDALTASERLLSEHPAAEIWCIRIGSRVLHHIGGRPVRRQT
jgi:23S rRNA maturation mini-RNase III